MIDQTTLLDLAIGFATWLISLIYIGQVLSRPLPVAGRSIVRLGGWRSLFLFWSLVSLTFFVANFLGLLREDHAWSLLSHICWTLLSNIAGLAVIVAFFFLADAKAPTLVQLLGWKLRLVASLLWPVAKLLPASLAFCAFLFVSPVTDADWIASLAFVPRALTIFVVVTAVLCSAERILAVQMSSADEDFARQWQAVLVGLATGAARAIPDAVLLEWADSYIACYDQGMAERLHAERSELKAHAMLGTRIAALCISMYGADEFMRKARAESTRERPSLSRVKFAPPQPR